MKIQELDVVNAIYNESIINQRMLSEITGHSLGVVNRSLKNLIRDGYLDENSCLTEKAKKVIKEKKPLNAIILAAGLGMRMVPINTYTPKALIEVKGQILIERIINQLHEVGINNIYIVVGYMKEKFEYLIDEFGVDLIVNDNYAEKNNIHSLALVADYLSNSYIIPCDIWCFKNPFNRNEVYSWYMVSDLLDADSNVRVNRKLELVTSCDSGNKMIGIAYLAKDECNNIKEKLIRYDANTKYDGLFWEEVLINNDRMNVHAKLVHSNDVVEINTYEQLREFDSESNTLKSDCISIIANVLDVDEKEITDIEVLKKGMTNRSFLFNCKNKKYIMRVPGEGTDQLINRKQEAAVYEMLKKKGLCDEPLYINPQNGYKITHYLEGVRTCNANNKDDLIICMKKLREFHNLNLQVNHTFDIFRQIEFYESLWGESSIFRDYRKTKMHVLALREYIEKHRERWCLTHIDSVPDNFLFYNGGLQLTDWEYAGMQDPHVDIAMFCIYSLYIRKQVDDLIDIYFEGECSK
ncbi:MAG: NTP transferase domain-containing protein, partial [Erysipelotrichales bacterium]|nr:NTP transferase domain-containing protein [Erysipelotrichales bacterium]